MAVVDWSLGLAKFELDNYEDAMSHLGDFVKMQDSTKTKNVQYVIALQIIGDVHQFFENDNAARSAWTAAFHVYSSSKDIVTKYPDLGTMLERRMLTSSEESEEPASQDGLFQRISADLVSRLSDEVNSNRKMVNDPAEAEIRKSIFMED